MMEERIVLASASPRRKEILTLAGLSFDICPAPEEYAPLELPVFQRVQALARSKAEQVAPLYPGRLVLGADTMVAVGEQILGKPKSDTEALEMLLSLQGKTHQVLTGVWIIRTDAAGKAVKSDGFTDMAHVRFFPIDREEAAAYVATGEPMDKAGAYGIQGRGMRFVQSIEGDYYTVMGLPGGRLIRFIESFLAEEACSDGKIL